MTMCLVVGITGKQGWVCFWIKSSTRILSGRMKEIQDATRSADGRSADRKVASLASEVWNTKQTRHEGRVTV
jgi:hypothetical protein